MDSNLLSVIALIFVALAFDFINGFHDAANSIATVVSTRVLSPGKAVIWAAFFNFVAAFTFGTAVAKTVGSGLVDIQIVSFAVIFAGLTGAIVWDLITWYYGLPRGQHPGGDHRGDGVGGVVKAVDEVEDERDDDDEDDEGQHERRAVTPFSILFLR